jgi:hypothetical protein
MCPIPCAVTLSTVPLPCYLSNVNSEFQPLADALYWEKVGRARRIQHEDRMKAWEI